ncbi:protein LURP-one-related 5-like [Typha latifolia]|uniref:protein LURP-one-related 5-like n=1 Tax=Typha latifolia TaxID=4733 RepID=UPI003C30DF8E
MSRVHPTQGKVDHVAAEIGVARDRRPSSWTVWKKSSMAFQGTDGFSVYDSEGKLSFRVDNYSRRLKSFEGEIVLMDGDGRALLSLRPQFLSMHARWNVYECEDSSNKRSKLRVFSMRRCSILQSSDEAEVFMGSNTADSKSTKPSFQMEGCFRRRCCKIRGSKGEEVAKICPKKAGGGGAAVMLGEDVFSLVVEPGVDCKLVMAFVVIMDRICRRSFTPVICS